MLDLFESIWVNLPISLAEPFLLIAITSANIVMLDLFESIWVNLPIFLAKPFLLIAF